MGSDYGEIKRVWGKLAQNCGRLLQLNVRVNRNPAYLIERSVIEPGFVKIHENKENVTKRSYNWKQVTTFS